MVNIYHSLLLFLWTFYHKHFFAANCEIRKTGGGPPPAEYTVAEELALSNNKGRPIMDGVSGAVQSDPGACSSKQVTLGMCVQCITSNLKKG